MHLCTCTCKSCISIRTKVTSHRKCMSMPKDNSWIEHDIFHFIDNFFILSWMWKCDVENHTENESIIMTNVISTIKTFVIIRFGKWHKPVSILSNWTLLMVYIVRESENWIYQWLKSHLTPVECVRRKIASDNINLTKPEENMIFNWNWISFSLKIESCFSSSSTSFWIALEWKNCSLSITQSTRYSHSSSICLLRIVAIILMIHNCTKVKLFKSVLLKPTLT